MNFLKQNKLAIGGAAVLLLLIWAYMTFFMGSSSASLTASDDSTPLSSDLIVTLQSIHSIKLNNAIFTDPVFVSLSDFGVTIPPENVGRRNPFEPLGSLGGSVSTSTLKLPPTR